MQPNLLLYGTDEILLKTRQWVLERRFRVEIAHSLAEVSALLRERRFDLLVLCHSLTSDECESASAIARQVAEVKVLNLISPISNLALALDAETCTPLDGPAALLEKACSMLGAAVSTDPA